MGRMSGCLLVRTARSPTKEREIEGREEREERGERDTESREQRAESREQRAESEREERGTAGAPSVRGQHGLTAGAEYIDLQKTGSSSRRHGVGFW